MDTDESSPSSYLIKFFIFFALLLPSSAFAASSDLISVEDTVRDYFKNVPVMIEIARCESKFKQYEADGSPLYGGWLNGMVGVFQLFERVHLNTASALGFNIDTLEGNLAYAKYLYDSSGTKPWNSSKSCWGNAVTAAAAKSTKSTLSVEEKRQELIKQITALLKIIEARKKVVANL